MPAQPAEPAWQIAECLLPGVTVAAAEAFAARVSTVLSEGRWPSVSFLGSLLMTEDEVVLCLFAGPLPQVRAVSERAGLPFDRIVGCVGLGWQPHVPAAQP